jgi:hypothetical protein
MKANVFIPLNNPTKIEMMIINPDIVKIEDNKQISLMWDQPGVVGEKES